VTSDGFRGKNFFWDDLSRFRSCTSYKTTNYTQHAGFMQRRFPNGTFAPEDPADCSPRDQQQSRECSLQSDNTVGFYESSSWEYSWFAPHDTAHLVTLMGGNVSSTSAPCFLTIIILMPKTGGLHKFWDLSCRQVLSSDSITFSMLVTMRPGMSHLSRCILRFGDHNALTII
jgi:glycosyl hydrolase family 92